MRHIAKAVCSRAVLVLTLTVAAPQAFATFETIIDNGPPSNRVDVVILGDGYTTSDIAAGTYDAHVNDLLSTMFAPHEDPFNRYHRFFNVHQVEVISNESGADIPAQGIYKDTALDASYSEGGLIVSQAKAITAMVMALDGTGIIGDIRLAAVNHTKRGGTAGFWAVFSAGNYWGSEIALHEIGHSFSGLADEYAGETTPYTGYEPVEVNATKYSDPNTVKWSNWIGYADPNHPEMGVVGVYEGARYYNYGLYRPTQTSKMRSLGNPFNAVCREQLILNIYNSVDPLDDWLDNSSMLTDPNELWVDTVDPNVIAVEWYVDGLLVGDLDIGETFDPRDFEIAPGIHHITAHAFDLTMGDWVRRDLDKLEMSIDWDVKLYSEVLIIGDIDRSGKVDLDDINPFVMALTDPNGYQAMYGIDPNWVGDCDGSGKLDTDDINPFVALITGGAAAIPEPATLSLLAAGTFLLLARKRR